MCKSAIITGGTGFVGSNLCRRLIKENWDISIIARESSSYTNIQDIEENVHIYKYDGQIYNLIEFFKERDANAVFHLASLFVAEHKSSQIDDLVESNLKLGLHVLEAMKESNTRLIINTGTSWQHYHTDEYNPVDLYAATKEAYEKLIKYYVEAEGIRAITLKLFDTYGETDRRHKLINILGQFTEDKKELLMSPGEQALDLVHIDDVVSAFVKAYDYLTENADLKYKVYGVGSGNEIRLKDLIKTFEQVTGKSVNIIWGGRQYRKREVMKLWNEYEILPNWNCKVNLVEGLTRCYRYR